MDELRDPLVDYYGRRAPEYERIYERDDPMAQAELLEIRQLIRDTFRGRRVLEVACGTGYWTRILAQVSESVTAIDASPEVLAEAEKKGLGPAVRFRNADAYELAGVPDSYNAALAAFWFSHIPRHRVSSFLAQLHDRLDPGAVVVMVDNVFVPGLGGRLIRSRATSDTFKLRSLLTGAEQPVLKNYYSEQALERSFSETEGLRVWTGRRYWSVRYRVPS